MYEDATKLVLVTSSLSIWLALDPRLTADIQASGIPFLATRTVI